MREEIEKNLINVNYLSKLAYLNDAKLLNQSFLHFKMLVKVLLNLLKSELKLA